MPPLPSTRHAVPVSPELGMEVELPDTWTQSRESFPPEVIAVYTDGRSMDPAFDTSVVLTLADAEDLDAWQAETRMARLATLPDVQVLDDRKVEEAPELRYAALMTTDGTGSTILVRSWARIADGHGLTLTVTTLPHIDAAHAQTLDAIARTWSLQTSATVDQNEV